MTKEPRRKSQKKLALIPPENHLFFWRNYPKVTMPCCKKNSGSIEGFMFKKELYENTTQHQPLTSWATLAEVNRFDIRKDPYYQSGELIGRQGIEKPMKNITRCKGVRYLQRDKFNRVIGPYQKASSIPFQQRLKIYT
ncbi:MAG: hypothetical protein CM15mP83_4060 [Flavobacteriaceae bacterium]|nr:MAG: hypothetical protein CM15mP83_4060 [Flavobacteriaceae bacterium]